MLMQTGIMQTLILMHRLMVLQKINLHRLGLLSYRFPHTEYNMNSPLILQ